MSGIGFIAERFLLGAVAGATLFILRRNLDQRKGALIEVFTVALMVVVTSIGMHLRAQAETSFGQTVVTVVQFVFLALPILVIVRLFERFRRGESFAIADLFRLMTVIALALFVAVKLPTGRPIAYAIVTSIYLLSHRAVEAKRPSYRLLSAAFSLGLLSAIGTTILYGESLLDLFEKDHVLHFLPSWTEFWALAALVAAISLTPVFMTWITVKSTGLHRMILWLQAVVLSLAKAPEKIYDNNLASLWHFRQGTCFLNHGSFGAVPLVVRNAQSRIRSDCENQPMNFFARELEQRWLQARFRLATWLGTSEQDIAFCENATAGMNELANWFPLQAGDNVLLNDHEYGAVRRIWERRCVQAGARLITVTLPMPFEDPAAITESVLRGCDSDTKLVIVSHITSPTAVRLPVEEICKQLKAIGVAVCIDGPHAILQEKLNLNRLGCDFYTASCHKWLCAPPGSGFVYVNAKWHQMVQPLRLSWGRLQPSKPEFWSDELLWTGTRDYSPYLTVPRAIEFYEQLDVDRVDRRNHLLACYARRRLCELPGAEPVTPAGREWFGWMVGVWLPQGDHSALQQRLFNEHNIEVPIICFRNRYLIRVSCHLYNSSLDIDRLVEILSRELRDC